MNLTHTHTHTHTHIHMQTAHCHSAPTVCTFLPKKNPETQTVSLSICPVTHLSFFLYFTHTHTHTKEERGCFGRRLCLADNKMPRVSLAFTVWVREERISILVKEQMRRRRRRRRSRAGKASREADGEEDWCVRGCRQLLSECRNWTDVKQPSSPFSPSNVHQLFWFRSFGFSIKGSQHSRLFSESHCYNLKKISPKRSLF